MNGWLLAALLLSAAPARAAEVLSGLDTLIQDNFLPLQGKRIGLITNQTGKDRSGRSSVTVLSEAPGVQLRALFAPEHGFTGTSEADRISSDTYRLPSGQTIPIYSLYSATKAPTTDMLRGLDALVFDIQDIGARFYTYSTTMGLAMEAAGAAGLDFVVLDRPNPITGDIIEGPMLAPGIRHFTAYLSVPVRHGLTMGELARLHNVLGNAGARIQVIPLKGWSREHWYDQTGLPWTKPSPNMPDVDAATLYPGIGCFESTNLSVGRGTPAPFRWVGAPWMDAKKVLRRLEKAKLPGISFALEEHTPTKSLYQGERSPGIRLTITDRVKLRPLQVFAHLLCALRDIHPEEFQVRWDEERRMVGNDTLRQLYVVGSGPELMVEMFNRGAQEFSSVRHAFLLY